MNPNIPISLLIQIDDNISQNPGITISDIKKYPEMIGIILNYQTNNNMTWKFIQEVTETETYKNLI